MKITASAANPLSFKADALIVPMPEGAKKTGPALNKALGGLPDELIGRGDFTGKTGETLLIHTYGKISAPKVLLVGLGKKGSLDTAEAARRCGGAAMFALKGAKSAALDASGGTASGGIDAAGFAEGWILAGYRYERYKKSADRPAPSSLAILGGSVKPADIRRAEAVGTAVAFAKDLVSTPARDMTPSVMLAEARKIKGVKVKALDQKECEKLGMGAYLSVSHGSHEPLKFIIVSYAGAKTAPVAFIGKSITFDSGGLSLKPSDNMEGMKYDMAGGAAVLGAMKAIAQLKLPINITAIMPATENLPSARPTKPGDVVRTIGGKTIEILNTDAEGRLALADALGYAIKFVKPSAMIDLATLTGACSVALGNEAMALMSNDDKFAARVEAASKATGEKVWRMPLFEEYADYIKSDIADLRNISKGRTGGLVSSGYFLKEFAGDTPWAHLDIASTAWTDKQRPYCPAGATGIGTRLLIRLAEDLSKA